MYRNRRGAAGFAIVVGLTVIGGTASSAPAFGDAKVVQIANGVGVTVAAGWTVSDTEANSITLHHQSPLGEFSVLAVGTVTATVNQAATIHLQQYAKGFGLKHLQGSTPQQTSAPGTGFDQISQINFSGDARWKKLIGAAVEYQNSTTGNGAFAAVISYRGSKSALKSGANAMLQFDPLRLSVTLDRDQLSTDSGPTF